MAIMSSTERQQAPRAAHVVTRRVRDDLWRVTSASGLAIGYIARVDGGTGPGYEARRLLTGGTAMIPIGGGWLLDDALACFTGP